MIIPQIGVSKHVRLLERDIIIHVAEKVACATVPLSSFISLYTLHSMNFDHLIDSDENH